MTSARFTLDSDSPDARGFEVNPGDSIGLKPESTAGIGSFVVSIVALTPAAAAATALSFSPSDGDGGGLLTSPSPSDQITIGVPTDATGAASWMLEAVANGGLTNGVLDESLFFRRILSLRSGGGLRVPVIGEGMEFDPTYSWTTALQEIANRVDRGAPVDSYSSGTPTAKTGRITVISGTVAAVTLPTIPTGLTGYDLEVVIKKRNLAGAVTVSGSQNIDGSVSHSLTGAYGALWLRGVSALNEWLIVGLK